MDHCAVSGIGKLLGKGRGIDDLLTLLRGHLAQIEDRVTDEQTVRRRQSIPLLRSRSVLLLLRRIHPFKCFIPCQCPFALSRIHGIESRQLVQLLLLFPLRQLAEAGHILHGALLIGQRHIAVFLHPVAKMALLLNALLLALLLSLLLALDVGVTARRLLRWPRRRRLAHSTLLRGLGPALPPKGVSRRSTHRQRKRRGKSGPNWNVQAHGNCGTHSKTSSRWSVLLNVRKALVSGPFRRDPQPAAPEVYSAEAKS